MRLLPEQPALGFVKEHIAAGSITVSPSGDWTWKFDAAIAGSGGPMRFTRDPRRVALINGEHGIAPAWQDFLGGGSGHPPMTVVVPAAFHHLMLDQPLALVTAIRALLAVFRRPDTNEA